MTTAIVNAHIILPPELTHRKTAALRFDRRCILSIDTPPRRGDQVIDLDGATIYPGLINAHDHLELNHFPRTKFRDVYANAHEWGEDFLRRLDEEPFGSLRRLPLARRCEAGGLKNLHAGVTTVAHHNPLHRPLRNGRFPVRVVHRYGWAHSLHFAHDVQTSYRRTPRHVPWMIHLAEGTDEIAAQELAQLATLNCLGDNTVLIHGVGLNEADRQRAIDADAGLVWCPSSNFFLLDATADVRMFAAAQRLAIGSDSRLTAVGDLLDELRAAHATGQIAPQALFSAVTTHAAAILRLARVGALLPGNMPDFFVTTRSEMHTDPYRALMMLKASEILAVVIGGVVRHGQLA